MPASRAERCRRRCGRGAAALALSLLIAAPAAAQLGRPIPLIAPPPPPQEAAPATPAVPPHLPAPPPPAAAGTDIETQTLAPVDSSWLGTLAETSGGLPRSMWEGTTRALVAAALPQLAPTSSPVLQDLARRLLLSDAAAPQGQDPPDRPSLAALRLDRLLALGIVAEALPLLDALPDSIASDSLDRTRVELRFAANDVTAACRTVQQRIDRYLEVWWARALVACQALAGDRAAALLGLSVLAEQKAPSDPVFDSLIESLAGRPHKIDKLPQPTPLRLALLAAAKLPLPPDGLAEAGPAALYGYATNETVPAERRLAAAERAALLGALPPEALGKLYLAIGVKPDEQIAAFAEGKLPDLPHSRAILYVTARSSADARIRAAALAALLSDAKKRGAFLATSRLVAPLLVELQPADADTGFAGDAARALLATGHVDAAAPWLAAADRSELRLVAHLAAPAGNPGDATALLNDAIAALAERDSGGAQARAALLLMLASAFEPVGPLDWQKLLAPPHQAMLPDAALWLDQGEAADGRRVGETALASLLLAQAGGALTGEP
ncbi:MAG TPA: hypothetical protein VN832_12355, partial [Stellaceae bacterium]|nr:hypothetical protein [Stellaceae bacterium]